MNIEEINKYLEEIRNSANFISSDMLEAIPYKNPEKNTWVEIKNPEFTSLCPNTGLPDFGTIYIKYVPDKYIVELKSLKYYFIQFRNTGIFYEDLSKLILNHLVKLLKPVEMVVEADFTPRGGISSKVISKYRK
jgi:7-cyano-7-deazaguanine reductase